MASENFTFPLSGPINLLARLGHGSVTVAARDHLAEAVVRLIPRNRQSDVLDRITVKMQGTDTAGHRTPSGRSGRPHRRMASKPCDSFDTVIEVPAGTLMTISSQRRHHRYRQ